MVYLANDAPKVLIIDDRIENITLLLDMLEPLKLDIVISLSENEIFKRIEVYDFDLILLDMATPNRDSYEICKELKNHRKSKDTPLIFISALGGEEDKLKGFDSGADDYITKPLLQKELIARVKLHLQKGMLFKSLKELLRKSYHELYNPLAVINTSLEMQNLKYGTTNYTDSITVASRTLQVVYDDLYYSLSTNQEYEKDTLINLSDFVKKRIDYFHYFKASKKITIEFNSLLSSWIKMKEVDLQRIVDNTISNAIKYAFPESVVKIDILENHESIILQSKNIGSVIKNPQQIFNKGYRENFEQVGMGIGLEIVASICHSYGIKVEVTSEDEKTSFKYYIKKRKYE